jgi:hypothetical protein
MSAEPIPPDLHRLDVKAKQRVYHDWESRTYDEKFSISYDERCIDYARDRFRKVVPEGAGFGRVLEVGAGTGFFLINLALGGCLDGAELHATDLSDGMLDVCRRNGAEHGLTSRPGRGTRRRCPTRTRASTWSSGTRSSTTCRSPARPSPRWHGSSSPAGTLVIAGEPTELGDKVSWVVKNATWRTFRTVTAVPGLTRLRKPSITESGGTADRRGPGRLEHEVDLHTFRPKDVEKTARLVGFGRSRSSPRS